MKIAHKPIKLSGSQSILMGKLGDTLKELGWDLNEVRNSSSSTHRRSHKDRLILGSRRDRRFTSKHRKELKNGKSD